MYKFILFSCMTLFSASTFAEALSPLGEECENIFRSLLSSSDSGPPLTLKLVRNFTSGSLVYPHQVTKIIVAPEGAKGVPRKTIFGEGPLGTLNSNYRTNSWIAANRKGFYEALKAKYGEAIASDLNKQVAWVDARLDPHGESIGTVSLPNGTVQMSMRLFEGIGRQDVSNFYKSDLISKKLEYIGPAPRRKFPFELMFEYRKQIQKVASVVSWLDQVHAQNQEKSMMDQITVREMGRYFISGESKIRRRAQQAMDMLFMSEYALEANTIFLGHITSDFNLEYFSKRYAFEVIETIEVAPGRKEYIVAVTGGKMSERLKANFALPSDPLLDYYVGLRLQEDPKLLLCSVCP
jgi:hypothetical protein